MADQHNTNIPAIGNQIANDIPDLKENLEFHKDAFERIFETWSDTDNSAAVIDSAVGFSDGTYSYDFPTNQVAASSIIMLGTSSTVVWMYLNAAPPGWKVVAGVTDVSLAVAGGSDAYNVSGGTTAGQSWANLKAHVHNVAHTHSHAHKWYHATGDDAPDETWNVSETQVVLATGNTSKTSGSQALALETVSSLNEFLGDSYTEGDSTAASISNSLAQSTSDVRPTAAVGKLYQLDTA